MRKTLLPFSFIALFSMGTLNAQSQSVLKDSSLQVSGSVDLYYKYDFAKNQNINVKEDVILGMQPNTVDFGMLDLKLKKQVGQLSVYSELAFGNRLSTGVDPQLVYNIQNLNATYEVNKKLSFTGGIMFRYQTFERLESSQNFHYTMSNGFFAGINNMRTGGIKAAYKFTDKIKLEAGLYNTYPLTGAHDAVSADRYYGLSDFCSQLFIIEPFGIKGLDASAAVWIEGQKYNGWHRNFQARYNVTKKFKLGFDATGLNATDSTPNNTSIPAHSYSSYVGYAQYKVCKAFTIGIRYDYLQDVEPGGVSSYDNSQLVYYSKEHYASYTLTGALKLKDLTLKGEFKLDNTTNNNLKTVFLDSNGNATNQASEIVIAAIYTF